MQDPGSRIQGDLKRHATCILHLVSASFFFVVFANITFSATSNVLEEGMVKAAAKGDVAQVRDLLDQGVSATSRHKLTGWSALTAASYHGKLEVVQMLIQAGADVNARDKTGGTPLLKAATVPSGENSSEILKTKAEIIRELLKAGADPQLHDNFGGSAWEQAVINNHQELIDAFEGVKGVKETQMIVAASTGDLSVLKKMIAEGADVNYKDTDGWSALTEATLTGQIEAVKILIDSHADVNMKHQKGWTALMVAAEKNQKQAAELLLKAGADSNIRSDDGATAAMIAMKQGNNDLAELLK
jgi:uncharacterized protein